MPFDGAGSLDDLGQADVVARGLELLTQFDGQSGDGVEGFDSLFVEGVGELGSAVGRWPKRATISVSSASERPKSAVAADAGRLAPASSRVSKVFK